MRVLHNTGFQTISHNSLVAEAGGFLATWKVQRVQFGVPSVLAELKEGKKVRNAGLPSLKLALSRILR
jgi:hypothetical protein